MTHILGLHLRTGSYSDRWVEYCRDEGTPFKKVDALRPAPIQQVEGFRAFAWHRLNGDAGAALIARQVTYALGPKDSAAFPDSATRRHHDGKVGRNCLLEAIGASVPRTWVFCDLKTALDCADASQFPKIFEQRGDAGSRRCDW